MAITTNQKRNSRGQVEYLDSFPVSGSTKIVEGQLVAMKSDGFLVPATDSATLYGVGVAETEFDNTNGANGAGFVRVSSFGCEKLMPIQGSAPTFGAALYAYDNEKLALTGSVVNKVKIGHAKEKAQEGDGTSTFYWVQISPIDG